jgi:hypothetical protein
MVEYNPFWFAVLIIIGVVFISMAILFGLKIAYSEPILNKDCVIFSDGKTAIILTEGGITDSWKFVSCDGSDIAWFINKGYHIDSEQSSLGPIDKVYMSR